MRYIRGSDLKALIHSEGRIEPTRTISILRQAANALDAAHEAGLVHRDVKPANLLLAPGPDPEQPDLVYLSDFGLTKRPTSRSGLTNTGQFIGTVDYMATELIDGITIDGRVDVYSLGCVLYECLTGDVPYPKDNEVAVIYAHLQQPPPSAAAIVPDLPTGIDDVIATAMAKDPDARYPTCAALATAARAVLSSVGAAGAEVVATEPEPRATTPASERSGPAGRRPLWRRRTAALAALAAVVVLVLVGVMVATREGHTPAAPNQAINVPRGLARIDPAANRVAARIEYEGACCVTMVDGTLWAGGNDELLKISATTNQIVADLPRACCPMTWVDELWGFRDADLVEIDPKSNRIVRHVPYVDLQWDGSEVTGGGLWLISGLNGVVLEIDKRTGEELARIRVDIGSVDGSDAGQGAVWFTDKPNNTALRIDERTHRVARIPVQHPSGIAVVRGGVWVVNAVDGILTELSPDGGAVRATVDLHMAEGNQSASLAVGPNDLWITDAKAGQLIRMDAASHRVVARIPVGPGPGDVAADADSVWITR